MSTEIEHQLLYSNGNIFIKYTEDKKGNKQGEYIKYFQNNNIEEKCYYKDNLLDGEYIKYFRNNCIEQRCFYKNNLLHGVCKKYKLVENESKLISSSEYCNGKLNGLSCNWCEDSGKPTIRATYKDGKKDGEYMEWYYDGSVYMRCFYVEDKLVSGSKKWYENGNLHSEFIGNTNFIYSLNGNLLKKQIYDENYDKVKEITYYGDKRIKSCFEFKDGKDEKYIVYYYPNDSKIKSIVKTKDCISKTITVVISYKDYKVRSLYNESVKLIRKDYINEQGDVIPSLWNTFTNFICKYFINSENCTNQEEFKLINQKFD